MLTKEEELSLQCKLINHVLLVPIKSLVLSGKKQKSRGLGSGVEVEGRWEEEWGGDRG